MVTYRFDMTYCPGGLSVPCTPFAIFSDKMVSKVYVKGFGSEGSIVCWRRHNIDQWRPSRGRRWMKKTMCGMKREVCVWLVTVYLLLHHHNHIPLC